MNINTEFYVRDNVCYLSGDKKSLLEYLSES